MEARSGARQGSSVAQPAVAGYPLGMTTTAVIYIFRCPKGRVYAGRRSVSPEALRCWPNRGHGPLPDGYCGSGTAWQAVARRHRAALAWRIVARVDGDRDTVNKAERRAIRLARAVWGQNCLNVADGGDGFTPDEARVQAGRNYARPEYVEKLRSAMAVRSADPDWQAQMTAQNRARGKDPEFRRKVSVGNKGRAKSPAHKAKIAEVNRAPEKRQGQAATARAQWADPAQAEKMRVGILRSQRRRRAAKALAPLLCTPMFQSPGATVWPAPSRAPVGITLHKVPDRDRM